MGKAFNKQTFNGPQGEARTKAILLKRFLVAESSYDIEGRDFSVEIIQESLEEQRKVRKSVNVLGIVQAKFFEGNNEVKIASEYVTDIEGARTDFFALIHTTDENLNDHTFFFTASEIKKSFKLRLEKNGKTYYIFKIGKNRTFEHYRDLPDHTINDVIEREILRTKEYRNQEFIQTILKESLKDIVHLESASFEFSKSLSGKHIVEKLLVALRYYDDFQSMLAWRVIEKINFHDEVNENTYYHQFKLVTNSKILSNFFSNLDIGKNVKIVSRSFFKGVGSPQKKVDEIITRLRVCNINTLDLRNSKIDIRKKASSICECPVCTYERLNFNGLRKITGDKIADATVWNMLSKSWALFVLGKFEEAIPVIKTGIVISQDDKQPVPEFISKYNLEILYRYTASYESVRLDNEMLKLKVSNDKKNILKGVADRTLLNGYKSRSDEKYL